LAVSEAVFLPSSTAVFEEEIIVEEEAILVPEEDDEDSDEIDIAFQANDEGYW
jgi:hypothetical protein